MSLAQFFWQGDMLARAVALLLLAMSVASWVVILWKTWLMPVSYTHLDVYKRQAESRPGEPVRVLSEGESHPPRLTPACALASADTGKLSLIHI